MSNICLCSFSSLGFVGPVWVLQVCVQNPASMTQQTYTQMLILLDICSQHREYNLCVLAVCLESPGTGLWHWSSRYTVMRSQRTQLCSLHGGRECKTSLAEKGYAISTFSQESQGTYEKEYDPGEIKRKSKNKTGRVKETSGRNGTGKRQAANPLTAENKR